MVRLIPKKMKVIQKLYLANSGRLKFCADSKNVSNKGKYLIREVAGCARFEQIRGQGKGRVLLKFPESDFHEISTWRKIIKQCRDALGDEKDKIIWIELPKTLIACGMEYELDELYDQY